MRQVHGAGEKLYVDCAGQSIGYGREGERALIFVATLGASNYTFACATADQRLVDWTGALVRALEYIDGVPALIVPDNAKALIADPDRYEPRASVTVPDLARHYFTALPPARPYRLQGKAKVEVGVQIVQRWFLARLRNGKFSTLAAVDAAVGDLLDDLNTRPFKRLPGSRRTRIRSSTGRRLKPCRSVATSSPVTTRRASISIITSPSTSTSTACRKPSCIRRLKHGQPSAASRSCIGANASPLMPDPMSGSGIPPYPSSCRPHTGRTWSGQRAD